MKEGGREGMRMCFALLCVGKYGGGGSHGDGDGDGLIDCSLARFFTPSIGYADTDTYSRIHPSIYTISLFGTHPSPISLPPPSL